MATESSRLCNANEVAFEVGLLFLRGIVAVGQCLISLIRSGRTKQPWIAIGTSFAP
jgi:hypothetical protein